MNILKKITIKSTNPFFDGLIAVLVVLNILPLAAPLLLHYGYEETSHIIYEVYSFFCHQFHWRSIHIHDNQMAWCTRDTFIWASLLLTALSVRYYNVGKIKWYWIIPFMIPIGLDGGIQTIATVVGYSSEMPYYVSTNNLRMLTGAFFGTGLGLVLLPQLKELTDEITT